VKNNNIFIKIKIQSKCLNLFEQRSVKVSFKKVAVVGKRTKKEARIHIKEKRMIPAQFYENMK